MDNPVAQPAPSQPPGDNITLLCQRAETRFLARSAELTLETADLSPQATRQLLHELQVHQIGVNFALFGKQ